MKIKQFLSLILGLVFSMLLLGCDTFLSKAERVKAKEAERLSWEEYLALLRLEEEYLQPEEELRERVEYFIQKDKERKGGKRDLVISRVETFTKTFEKGFVLSDGRANESNIEFYLFILTDMASEDLAEGYALACSDIRVGGLIGFVPKGNWYSTDSKLVNMIKGNLDGNIQETISIFNSRTKDDIIAAKAKQEQIERKARFAWYWDAVENAIEDKAPLIETEWVSKEYLSNPNNGGPYNWALHPEYFDTGNPQNYVKFAPGTDVIALSQLLAYQRWVGNPSGFAEPAIMSNHYGANYSGGNVHSLVDSFSYGSNTVFFNGMGSYDFITMTSETDANNINLGNVREQIATLVFQTGCKMEKVFGPNGGPNVEIDLVLSALRDMGYSYYGVQVPYYSDHMEAFYSMFGIKRSIDEELPVYGTVYDNGGNFSYRGEPDFSFLIDGYYTEVTRYFYAYIHVNTGEPGNTEDYWALNYFNPANANVTQQIRYITGICPP